MNAAPLGLILIVIDALRADGVSPKTAPNLDALGRQGVVFSTTVAQSNWTLPSLASIMTALYPSEHGALESPAEDDWSARLRAGTYVARPGGRLDESRETLAEVLRARGFATEAAVSGGFCRAEFGFGQGFERFVSKGLTLEELMPDATAFLAARRGRPFFLYLHAPDVHDYGGRVDMRKLSKQTPEALRAGYAAGVAKVDAQVGRLMGALDELGLSSTTLVVVTADHGEALGELGKAGHKNSAREELLRVPLLLRGPGVLTGGRPPVLARSIDVMPTVLELLGVPAPPRLSGRSLAPALRGEPIAPAPAFAEAFVDGAYETVLRTDAWKYVRRPGGRSELYDLSRDPGETRNLAGAPEEKALAAQLDAWRKGLTVRPKAKSSKTLDAETARELERAGYLK